MSRRNKNIAKQENRLINPANGRVFSDKGFLGYGILEKGTQNVHMTHDFKGRLMEKRMVVIVTKMIDES